VASKIHENRLFSISQRQLQLDMGCRERELDQVWTREAWSLWVPGSVQLS